jgi:hypothetical protein
MLPRSHISAHHVHTPILLVPLQSRMHTTLQAREQIIVKKPACLQQPLISHLKRMTNLPTHQPSPIIHTQPSYPPTRTAHITYRRIQEDIDTFYFAAPGIHASNVQQLQPRAATANPLIPDVDVVRFCARVPRDRAVYVGPAGLVGAVVDAFAGDGEAEVEVDALADLLG